MFPEGHHPVKWWSAGRDGRTARSGPGDAIGKETLASFRLEGHFHRSPELIHGLPSFRSVGGGRKATFPSPSCQKSSRRRRCLGSTAKVGLFQLSAGLTCHLVTLIRASWSLVTNQLLGMFYCLHAQVQWSMHT